MAIKIKPASYQIPDGDYLIYFDFKDDDEKDKREVYYFTEQNEFFKLREFADFARNKIIARAQGKLWLLKRKGLTDSVTIRTAVLR